MYELVFDEQALKSLHKLPQEISSRIIKKLQQAKTTPRSFFKRLTAINAYSLRVGDYRAVADITESTIVVLYVDHRKRVYDRLD